MKTKQTVLNEINEIRRYLKMQPLTESELMEHELSQIDLNSLNEGWWENAKYALSKLGRYKAGGKIMGKTQTTSKANADIAALLDKKGNELIKILDSQIKKTNPEFPNNRTQDDFLNTILDVAYIYDSIIAATKKNPNETGYMPTDAANAIIADLVIYVKKYLDVDLTAAFSVFTEGEKIDEVEDIRPIDPAGKSADLKQKFAGTKQAIKTGDAQAYGSERMKTLKSWRLPLALTGAAASFGALSWLIEYMFPADKISQWTPQIIQEKAQAILGNVKPGEGMTQIMNRTLGTNLNPNSNPKDVVDALAKLGGGDANKGLEIITQKGGIFSNPEAAKATLSSIVNNPTEHGNSLKQVFSGTWAGTGRAAGDTLVTLPGRSLVGMVVKAIKMWTLRTTAIKGAKATIAAPVLKTLGIALLAGGAVVALSRYKGRKSSRAQLLNDLMQYLRPAQPTKENPNVIPQQLLAPGAQQAQLPGGGQAARELPAGKQQGQLGAGKQQGQLPAGKAQAQIGGGKKLTQPEDIDDIVALMEFVNLNRLLEGLAENVNDNDMCSMISEALNTSQQNALQSSNHSKLFKQVASVMLPDTVEKIRMSYREKYGQPLNRIKLANFLQNFFNTLGNMRKSDALTILRRFDGSVTDFNKFINSFKSDDAAPGEEGGKGTSGLNIGGYDLTNVSPAARTAIFNKSKEILQRNNMDLTRDNIENVITQLIQDINASGKKQIPKAGESIPTTNATGAVQYSKGTQSQQGGDQTTSTNTGAAGYTEPTDTDQGLGDSSPYYKEPKRK
jgi:hypothetical protein